MIRYKKLGYVALDVTDIERSSQFYENMVGLQPVSKIENQIAFFRCSRDHHNIVLYQAEDPGLRRVGLEVETPEQLEIAFEHFTKAGLEPKEVEKEELKLLCQGRSFRFREPNTGILFELYSDMMQMGQEYKPTVTKIARLGHVVVHTKHFDSALKFFMDVMNFKVSDYLGDGFAFMRCFPNPYHHSFALSSGKENKLHHVNFMVTDMDDIGTARNRLLANDVRIVFGPGKHAPSTSIFLYFLDPDGITVEYSFGMEEFPENNPRKPRILEPSLSILDTWGGKPDPQMGSVGKIG
ncbi:VOC family protein [Parageobacillus thermoglucosidasius]|uniref:VOC family protein n=1 Tax=Parageobacillus thermoglucosidasius TaxID=1426 RepID=UPI000B5813A0|nr:VOC family protein [Parageobacillus thermoglucosidasius]OUM86330.1 MAG: 2,3-dihydroxy-p-cumate-3,4-dioxygenase [Parageobacillus thermoglucosidasius]